MESVQKQSKQQRDTEKSAREPKSKKSNDKNLTKNIQHPIIPANISNAISSHSDLLSKSIALNRTLLKEKDSLILLQQNYMEKCNEFVEKETKLKNLKIRMEKLLETPDKNFITLSEESTMKDLNELPPVASKLVDEVKGINNIFEHYLKI